MAIQQVVPITINLQGDGTSTVFRYTLSQLFAVTMLNDQTRIIYASQTPSSISASSSFGIPITAAMSTGKMQLTFATAPGVGQQGTVTINLFFVSQ